jgi:Animal haem peroxidase.
MIPHLESLPNQYCRLFPPSALKNPDRRPALSSLGEAMLDPVDTIVSDPNTPEFLANAGYTYFGQFIDHDLTEMDPLLAPLAMGLPPGSVPAHNLQTPQLDLSHLYGHGPSHPESSILYESDGVRLKVGPRSASGRSFDVRVDPQQQKPVLADPRSSENLIIRQMVAVFARLHNAAVAQWKFKISDPQELFEQARLQTAWQFQYLVVQDYLRRILDKTVFKTVFEEGKALFEWEKTFSIPLEFAVGAFRFGHSMVRSSYVFSVGDDVVDFKLEEIMERALQTTQEQLEPKWEINWGCFFKGSGPNSIIMDARPIDTLVSEPLHHISDKLLQLFTVAKGPVSFDGDRFVLPVRTLLRGESENIQLASGQTAADILGIPRLNEEQLTRPRLGTPAMTPHRPILERAQILDHTPLWYYVLKESEIVSNGSRLGPVGSQIVAETISGALRYDPNSCFFNPTSPSSLAWRTRQRMAQPPIWRIGGRDLQMHTLMELFFYAPDLPVD